MVKVFCEEGGLLGAVLLEDWQWNMRCKQLENEDSAVWVLFYGLRGFQNRGYRHCLKRYQCNSLANSLKCGGRRYFTISHIATFSNFLFATWAVYIYICLSWNKYRVLFCSVLIINEQRGWSNKKGYNENPQRVTMKGFMLVYIERGALENCYGNSKVLFRWCILLLLLIYAIPSRYD